MLSKGDGGAMNIAGGTFLPRKYIISFSGGAEPEGVWNTQTGGGGEKENEPGITGGELDGLSGLDGAL